MDNRTAHVHFIVNVTKICKCAGKRAFGLGNVGLKVLFFFLFFFFKLLSAMKGILSVFKCFLSNFNFRNSRVGCFAFFYSL